MEEDNNLELEENTEQETTTTTTNTTTNIKCVFVSGIPYTTTEEAIKEKFQTCGIIR
jgi:RNA recognition motif-containing protein